MHSIHVETLLFSQTVVLSLKPGEHNQIGITKLHRIVGIAFYKKLAVTSHYENVEVLIDVHRMEVGSQVTYLQELNWNKN